MHFAKRGAIPFALSALLVGCSEASLATNRDADRAPTAEPDASMSSTTSPLSRSIDLCAGTSTQLGWSYAREAKGELRLLSGQGLLVLPDEGAGRLEIDAVYAAPDEAALEVALTGDVEVREGMNRLGIEEEGVRMLEARLTSPAWGLRLDLLSDTLGTSQVFELASAQRTRWLLCRPSGESCTWRVPLIDCSSDAGEVGLVEADFGQVGKLSLEVWRAYLGLDNYSRVLRAWGSLDDVAFEVNGQVNLLMDAQEIYGLAERFAVMFDEPRGTECGIELALPFDLSGPLARTLSCDFQPVRDIEVVEWAAVADGPP